MDKQTAIQIWEECYGDKEIAYDFASHPMKKEDFQNEQSHYGWDIDGKKQYNSSYDNMIPCSINTIKLRGKKDSFKICNHQFEVRKGNYFGSFSIYDITDRNHPLNMDPSDENQDKEFNHARFHEIASSGHENKPQFKIPTLNSIYENVFNSHLENADLGVESTYYTEEDIFEDLEESPEEEGMSADQESEKDTSQEEITTSENDQNHEVAEEQEELISPSSQEENVAPQTVVQEDNENFSLHDTENEKEELENQIHSLNLQLSSLQSEYAALKMNHDALEREKEEASQKYQVLQEEWQSKENDIVIENQKLKEDLSVLTQKNQELENQNHDVCQNQEKTQQEMNQLISQNEENVTSILAVNNSLKERINVLSEEACQHQQEMESLKEEKEALRSELELVKENNLSLSSQINDFSSCQEEMNSLRNQVQELNDQLSEKNNCQDTAQNNREELENQLYEANNRIQYLADSVAEKEKANQSFAEEIQQKEEQIIRLQSQNQSLQQEQEKDKTQFEELKNQWIGNLNEMKKIQADYNQLDAQSQLVDDQIDVLNSENKKLTEEMEVLKAEHEELNTAYQNQKMELESYKKDYEEKIAVVENLKQNVFKAESDYQTIVEDKDRLNARIESLNHQLAEKQEQINEKDSLIASTQLIADKLREEKAMVEEQAFLKQKTEEAMILFLSLHGDKKYYSEMIQELDNIGLEYNQENMTNLFSNHKEWQVKEDNSINENIQGTELENEEVLYLDDEKKKYEKALSYYIATFKEEKAETTDFAGRLIRLNDFGKRNMDTGWDYCLYDSEGLENQENVLVANYLSLKDFSRTEPFTSNGHMFQLVKENESYKIQAADFVTDPYDYSQALRVVNTNRLKTAPLVYLFVKCVPIQGAMANPDAVMDFFDIMDRTVKRCCPQSFIEMKTLLGGAKGNVAFVTFDGAMEESYHEVLDYAVLMNSYRKEFFKRGKMNAILVINEVNVPFSKRHLDFDSLISASGDVELRALRYEFNMAVINSQIKRTIHIGPAILDKIPVNQNQLTDSLLGQGDFAKMYRFSKKFKIYNFIYSLTNIEEEQ